MSQARYEVVGRLPPGGGGKTSLAVTGGAGAVRRVNVLRPVGQAELIPVVNVHPHLPAPLGVETVEGVQVAVYEFFPGATLHEIAEVYRAQEQLPPLGLVLRIAADAARALHVAHEHQDALGGASGLVHGGIADTSLLMGFDGEVRVLDFGLRKQNRFGSPEAVAGGPFTPKSDVFSLAAAVHSALTGFDGQYAETLSKAPSRAAFPPPSAVHPDATPELDALLMRALLPDFEQRLSSTLDLAGDLERIAGDAMPQPAACASRLKQLFEERLDGFRNILPRAPAEGGAPAPVPSPSAPKRSSKPSMPSMPAASAPPPPRKSGPRNNPIPMGTQPDANPLGRRVTPAEVKAAFGDPDGDEMPDEATIVMDSDPALAKLQPPPSAPKRPELGKGKVEPTRSERPSGERNRPSRKSLAALPEVPWEQSGLLGGGVPTDQRGVSLADAGEPPTGGSIDIPREAARLSQPNLVPEEGMAIEDLPTGLSRRVTGAQPAVSVGGSSEEEKAAARGQELVDTGDLEPEEADDLREQPTVVRVSGSQPRVDPSPDFASAFGDPDAVEEQGTAIITAKDGHKGEPPLLHPPEPVSEVSAPGTGVLEANRKKAEESRRAPKKRGGGPRKMIAFLLLLMAGGFGYVSWKNPALVKAKSAVAMARVNALLVKYGLKKPPPPPEEPVEPPPEQAAGGADGGGLQPVAAPVVEASDGGAPALGALEEEEDADGGEEEEEDDAGTVTAADGGRHADGGVVHKVKKKKKKRRTREWWQTH